MISGLKVSRGGKPVLGGGAAAVPSPGVALCTGPNGSGKTTLLEAIAGILPSSDGSVSLGGRVADLKVESWRNTVGYLASDGGTVPLLTAAEQLRLVMEISGVGRGEAEVRIEQLADIYTLGESLHTRADALSTGTRKRLGIAIAVPPLSSRATPGRRSPMSRTGGGALYQMKTVPS